MPYVGNIPAEKYASFEVQHFTTSATTSYTLTHAVANELDIRLVLNNVVQQPGGSYAYTASATTLTLSSATTSSDTLYCVYIGKAVQTVNPGAGSVNESTLQVSNSPTNGYVLSAQSGAAGGLTWAADAAGTITAFTNGVDNRVVTATSATALNGESSLTFDGSTLAVTADVITGFQDTAPTATSMGTAHANDSTLLLGGLNSGATQGSLYVGGQNISADGVEGAIYGFSGGNQNAGIEFLEGSGDAYGQISMKVGQGTGGTLVEGMKIDSAGIVTKPLQPAFNANASSAQNGLAATTWITGEFDTEIFDVNADYDNGTYIFTAPVTGKYLFTVMWTLERFSGRPYSMFNTSNRNYTLSYFGNDLSGGADSFTGSVIADMDASDTCKWRIYAYDDSDWDLQCYNFSGTLLC